MLCDPGDEVLIPAPYWVSYPTMVELVDGVPVIVPSDELSDFKVHAHHIEKKITPKTKVLLLNSPSNPTGQVYTKAELEDIARLLKRHPQIVVISDDIYNQLVFTGDTVAPHLLHCAPELKDRMILVNGASKSLSMTGWRIGWALGPEPVAVQGHVELPKPDGELRGSVHAGGGARRTASGRCRIALAPEDFGHAPRPLRRWHQRHSRLAVGDAAGRVLHLGRHSRFARPQLAGPGAQDVE